MDKELPDGWSRTEHSNRVLGAEVYESDGVSDMRLKIDFGDRAFIYVYTGDVGGGPLYTAPFDTASKAIYEARKLMTLLRDLDGELWDQFDQSEP